MRYLELIKCAFIGLLCAFLVACPATDAPRHHSNPPPDKNWQLSNLIPSSFYNSMWSEMAGNFHLGGIKHPSVQKKIHWYARQQDYLNELSSNAKPYLYYVYQQTQKRGMPAEIALMPMIESNYNPFSISVRGATGLWQMMPGTASGFGIKINWWYDGRRDIIASTKAALDYLSYLHDYFGNWLLAIAAYDSGQGTVEDAIVHNRRLHKPTDFWDLPLPYETKSYVPKLLALAAIVQDPSYYHVTLLPIANHPYFKAVNMDEQMNMDHIARMAGVSVATVRQLNPGFRRWATSPNQSYALLLPMHRVAAFKQVFLTDKDTQVTWYHHRVKPGESLSVIAANNDTTVPVLRKVNDLRSSMIHVGESLLVPKSYYGKGDIHFEKEYGSIAENHLPGPKRFEHSVKRGDTLWTIAARYDVTPAQIRYWNNLPYRATLKLDQQIMIWKSRLGDIGKSYYYYHVRPGDSLSVIARRFGTSMQKIKRANAMHTDMVRMGQLLKIPKPLYRHRHYHALAKNQMVIHYVHPGESLDSLARYYRVSEDKLAAWNHLRSHQILRVGQKIQIYLNR